MKKRTMITAAFAALLAIATVGTAVTANAADVGAGPSSLGGTGKVEVTEGKADGNNPVDPEKPDDPIKPDENHVTPSPDTGTLLIEQVSVLDFGSITTGTTALTGTTAVNAAEVPLTTVAGTAIQRGNFVQFTDLRSANYGYKVSAALTKQFTNTTDATKVLTGSTISFANPILTSIQDKADIPATIQPTFTLAEGASGAAGAATTVVDNSTGTGTVGKGTFSLEFGQSTGWTIDADHTQGSGTAGTSGDSVKLSVPADTRSSMVLGDYAATITWTIEAAP